MLHVSRQPHKLSSTVDVMATLSGGLVIAIGRRVGVSFIRQ